MIHALLALLLAAAASAAQLGDDGHFLQFYPRLHVWNPDGRAWTATLRVLRWPVPGWTAERRGVRITGPDGAVLRWEEETVVDGAIVLRLPAGAPGAYTIEPGAKVASKGKDKTEYDGLQCWLDTDLPRAVVWTGDPDGHAIEGRRFNVQASVPRRWWFWVPPGTTSFAIRAQRADRWMSQREDFGFTVFSPRGQRVTTLFGQPPKDTAEYRQEVERTVEVEPGAAGRFWCVEMRLGDSHNHSKMNLALVGVPPYVARSPEEWFDPTKGLPAVPLYDTDPFIQASYEPKDEARWPKLQHWSPCPALGDPDGIELRDGVLVSLWNPEDRALRLGVGSYLPHSGMAKGSPPWQARVRLEAGGKGLLDERWDVPHWHGGKVPPMPRALPATGAGVAGLDISEVERCWLFTYPATPLVLRGREAAGWSRFSLEIGTARHWFFRVPAGTRSFKVRAACAHDTDVMDLEVNAPDRVMARIYARQGEVEVPVPPGLDGRIWHIRTDVGSASRLVTTGTPEPRYLGLYLTLELQGVPGLLAPTWEQWFDPAAPKTPWERTP